MTDVDHMEQVIAKSGGGKPPLDPHAAVRMQQKADQDAADATAQERVEHARIVVELARRHAEQEKLRPLPPITQASSAKDARPDDEMVLMMFPHPCFIWAEPTEAYPKRHKVAFGRGIQQVPVSLKDNWYLRDLGVREVELPREKESEGDKKPEEVKS